MDAYTSKATTIHAEQFDGSVEHAEKIVKLVDETDASKDWTQRAEILFDSEGLGTVEFVSIDAAFNDLGSLSLLKGDWLIRGTEGEYYPCKDAVFTTKYEQGEH